MCTRICPTYLFAASTNAGCIVQHSYRNLIPTSPRQSASWCVLSMWCLVIIAASLALTAHGDLVEEEREDGGVEEEFDPIQQLQMLIEQEETEGAELREEIRISGNIFPDPWEVDQDLYLGSGHGSPSAQHDEL